MKVRRLGWAGIQLEHEDESIVIDLLEERQPLYAQAADAVVCFTTSVSRLRLRPVVLQPGEELIL